MRENRLYGSEGGGIELNRSSLPLSTELWSARWTAVYGRSPPQAVLGPRFTAGPARRAHRIPAAALAAAGIRKRNWASGR
jgi:hypothetical protein